VLSFSSLVWWGVKKEEGNNNIQKGEKWLERKGDIFTIKIMVCLYCDIGSEWE
jgi:hypothetical protein